MQRKKDPDEDIKHRSEMMKGLSQLSQIGATMIACIFIGFFVGRFLDSWLNTSPWFLLIFILTGIVAGFKSVYDISKRWEV